MVISEATRVSISGGTSRLRKMLSEGGWTEEAWPMIPQRVSVSGSVLVRSFPILGIEKYLGMPDSENRIAWFSSLKLTNDSYSTNCFLRFDPNLTDDVVILGGKLAEGKELKRVMTIVNKFREMTGIQTKVLIISRHIPKVEVPATAKGLGLSASAGAAIAKALIEVGAPELRDNNRFLNVVARYLAGSATSSAAGGFSVWLSNDGIKSEDCYAVRVDDGSIDIKLVVVPIPKLITTDSAHDAATKSPLYESWAAGKVDNVAACIEAIRAGNVDAIGKMAEADSRMLHHLLSDGGFYNWNGITLDLLSYVDRILRQEFNMTAYCTMDTGPSVVVITTSKDVDEVQRLVRVYLGTQGHNHPVYTADLAGSPEVLDMSQRDELLVTSSVQEILEGKEITL